jgi:hypothetical protein
MDVALRGAVRFVPDRHAHKQALENPSLGTSGRGMPRMIRELEANPRLGFLGADVWFARTILAVQYWRSFEALEAYAHAHEKAHLPAWASFNRAVGANGDVGIFHETYRIEPGACENVYVNMPPLCWAGQALSSRRGEARAARVTAWRSGGATTLDRGRGRI